MKKSLKQIPLRNEKWCNICGKLILVYQIIDNAPVCYDCVPEQKLSKKIPNEKNMLTKILEDKNEQKKI